VVIVTAEIDHYELLIEVHGPDYHDHVVIKAKPDEQLILDPDHVDRGGVVYERYESRGEWWQEIRLDYITHRVMRAVMKPDRIPTETPLVGDASRIGGEELG
jgi:hypothetical protein